MHYIKRGLIIVLLLTTKPVFAEEKENAWKISLFGDDAPASTPWTEPASLSATINDDAKDSYAYQFSLKAARHIGGDFFLTPKVKWKRNNQQKSAQNKFSTSLGLHWEPNSGNLDGFIQPWSHYVDLAVGYSRKSVFADLTKNGCDTNSTPVFCHTQHEEALEGKVQYSPFHISWEKDPDGKELAYSVIPAVGFFWNDLLNQPVNPETLQALDGSVAGFVASFSAAISPKLYDHRWKVGITAQTRHRLHSSVSRADGFTKSAQLLKISLDYRLYDPVQVSSGFLPSVGFTYTTGEDPLTGLKKQENLMLALKVAYK